MMNIFRQGTQTQTDIFNWLTAMRERSYIPESGYSATAVFRIKAGGREDYYFSGTNAENVDHRITTHAEEAAIAAMITGMGGSCTIVEGWVMGGRRAGGAAEKTGTCCGKCRQQIAGFAGAETKIHAVSLGGDVRTTTVGDFLPDPFTFRNVFPDGLGTRLAVSLAPADIQRRLIRKDPQTREEITGWITDTNGFTPFTRKASTTILKLTNGAYVCGSKVEDAAFLSINPAQSAVAVAVSEFGSVDICEIWASGNALTLSALQSLQPLTTSPDVPVFLTSPGQGLEETALSEAVLRALRA